MSTYQRYLSKSLIFFSILFVIFLLFIESNIGFKWIFNCTSRFFIGLNAEEISGNWRNFTLKNIKYNIDGISIKANSINFVIDIKSLFKKSTIFKEVKVQNLIISLKKNKYNFTNVKSLSINNKKNDLFIKYPIIFKKIYIDNMLLESSIINMSFLNILSGIELVGNNIIIFPTYIDDIDVSSSKTNTQKKYEFKKFNFIKNLNNSKKIYNILYHIANKPKIFISLNINLKFLKCNKINFINYKEKSLFEVQLKANIKNNILKIQKAQINSSFFKMQYYGKIVFHKDYSISCIIKNKIFIPTLHNKIMKFLFQVNLDKKFKFKLKTFNLYKVNINGIILLDNLNYPFYMRLKIYDLVFPIRKDFNLSLNKIQGILRGKINNYSLSLKNILNIQSMPSMFIGIYGKGNLKNIFLKKIKIFPIKKIGNSTNISNSKKNSTYNQYILKLIGKINLLGKLDNNIYNIYAPKIRLNSNFMKKKLSILGSLHYKNFHFLKIPGLHLFAGNNELYIQGLLADKYDIYSSINANNLDYFVPDLKGKIKGKVKSYSQYTLPAVTGEFFGNDISWNGIYLNSIKIFTKINCKNTYSGNVSINTKNIDFSNFHINSLNIQTKWNYYQQKFHFLLKSDHLYINVILNEVINSKTGHWYSEFKKLKIKTIFSKISIKKSSLISYINTYNINDLYKKNINNIDMFLFTSYETKKHLCNMFNNFSTNFKSEVSINAKLKWILGKKISDGKIFLTGKNIKLEKNTEEKFFFENIDYLKLSINIINNTLRSKIVGKKNNTLLKYNNIIGYLNIIDLYNRKNIEGNFIISNFPISFLNFFTTNFKQVKGKLNSKIKIFGTVYQPEISADVSFKDIFIKSNNILKYMTLFFPYFLDKIDSIKINQEVIMKEGEILFKLQSILKNSSDLEWNLLFNSKKIEIVIFPKIKLKLSSQLNLHYLLSKYNLIGYVKFPFFCFKIHEKDFIF
ncbi:translocation/assembly module TamB [Buchnera aphidicola]|uniref:Translocation/assembly module TamB n=1 Tax=Buchnera aphidicola (Artemisaphis artemisicola) TaxID=1241836 RepID=A0A4D6XIU9_9GAMM|nr:translocation/assembly module TamB [Buchnera aphidicola]QCI15779.1 translocation/assembly module TamB [Buchnera aphidicola (Artemisaphis artemisicola)]